MPIYTVPKKKAVPAVAAIGIALIKGCLIYKFNFLVLFITAISALQTKIAGLIAVVTVVSYIASLILLKNKLENIKQEIEEVKTIKTIIEIKFVDLLVI